MELATPIKECQDRERAGCCEDGAMSGDCGGTSASDLSTSYNSSPGTVTEADDPNSSGNLSGSTSATSDPPPQRLRLPPEPREESAALVIRNIFSIMKQNGGEFGLPRKAVSEATGLGMLALQGAPRPANVEEAKVPVAEKRKEPSQEVEELRQELLATRCELESAKQDTLAAEQLRENQAALIEKLAVYEQREAQSAEDAAELEEKARRDEEAVNLERHIFEVEIRRVQRELQLAAERTEALDKDLKQAQKMANKQQRRERKVLQSSQPKAKEVMSRHELALRASFQEERSNSKKGSKNKDKDKSRSEDQGWFSFGCCSSVEAAPKRRT
eukprot:gb/GFBE01011280.1/.p1 GENE.gb/GFBE01011280.1/~~gb/GFBE01011280.1/.p1  ORF type:complete len:330 (+),score=92.54 gb/GFBE01011280.1/:1-990(+)